MADASKVLERGTRVAGSSLSSLSEAANEQPEAVFRNLIEEGADLGMQLLKKLFANKEKDCQALQGEIGTPQTMNVKVSESEMNLPATDLEHHRAGFEKMMQDPQGGLGAMAKQHNITTNLQLGKDKISIYQGIDKNGMKYANFSMNGKSMSAKDLMGHMDKLQVAGKGNLYQAANQAVAKSAEKAAQVAAKAAAKVAKKAAKTAATAAKMSNPYTALATVAKAVADAQKNAAKKFVKGANQVSTGSISRD